MNTNAQHHRVAAFFDLDGTLLEPPSLERQLVRYLAWRGELTAGNWLRWTARFLARIHRDPLDATHGNKAHYAGVRVNAMASFCALFRRHPLLLIPAALARLEWHASQGHQIFFVSGTLRPLAECVAAVVAPLLRNPGGPAPIYVIATDLEANGRQFTGRVRGEAVCGRAKASAIARVAVDHQLDLNGSFAYGDRYSDRWILASVGHPAAVNPCFRLRLLAGRCGWPILRWKNSPAASPRPAVPHLQPTV